ncbi:MAG: ABC transporter, partial [Chloroflexi bacterium]
MTAVPHRRTRNYRILRLFFGLVLSFTLQYLRARLSGRSYDFFADSSRNRRRAIKIRTTALDMGGVLIKVGQFLSSRVDLLPTEYIEELALLQDEVPAVPFERIRAKVEHDLQAPLASLFTTFDPTPVAAASLGQVHRATLPTGETVAVKVQRPNIGSVVEADLDALRYIVGWLNRHTPLPRKADLPLILREFEDTLRLELNYHREGHHAERLSVAFKDDPRLVVPRVYWSHSGGDVLTLQFMAGTKITDLAGLERQGISRSLVAETLMRAYLKQVLVDGFFHADP